MKKIIALALGVMALAGCATKQYPQAPTVTGEESAVFDCKAVQQEIARAHSIQQEIESTGRFDGRTVLGFLGDFGVGNGMAKDEARKKAESRLIQLQAIESSKCSRANKPV
ncbi:lipoprotein [Dickeya fangzhongdai]|uniref:lipoprotein n=1 Tax=Dickeya fangzhongdai TaxID=1778540 RepID=UPI0004F919D3|nr:lipoprotein [Dickeya fangzhongdai]AIR71481.1 lipoprotein [Dickeya fangzhongdai]KGT98509.1 lipoprotein [Dickeya fangzhongdai]